MREVVKTLKQFAEEKKQIERFQAMMMKEGENPNYRIQLFQKVKDENIKLHLEINKIKKEYLTLKETFSGCMQVV